MFKKNKRIAELERELEARDQRLAKVQRAFEALECGLTEIRENIADRMNELKEQEKGGEKEMNKKSTLEDAEVLERLIDKATIELDAPNSHVLARYLVECGVKVTVLSAEIGTIVYCLCSSRLRDSGSVSAHFITTKGHFKRERLRGAVLYVMEKPFRKSDEPKLGSLVFLTREDAEKKLKEYLEEPI